jgi:hypothetical protein
VASCRHGVIQVETRTSCASTGPFVEHGELELDAGALPFHAGAQRAHAQVDARAADGGGATGRDRHSSRRGAEHGLGPAAAAAGDKKAMAPSSSRMAAMISGQAQPPPCSVVVG